MANKLFTVALTVALAGCSLGPKAFAPSPWTTVAFEQAKAECVAQLNRDSDRSPDVFAGLGALQDAGPRITRCLNGYGYVAVR